MPTEDLTTYTLYDEFSLFNVIDATQYNSGNIYNYLVSLGGDICYLYKDKGVGFLTGDFTIRWEENCDTAKSQGSASFMHFSNRAASDVYNTYNIEGESCVWWRHGRQPTQGRHDLYIQGVGLDSDNGVIAFDLWRYFTLVRDADGGTAGNGLYTLYIRSDSHEGTLVDTLSAESDIAVDFRYFYPFTSYNFLDVDTKYTRGLGRNYELIVSVGNPYYAYAQQ